MRVSAVYEPGYCCETYLVVVFQLFVLCMRLLVPIGGFGTRQHELLMRATSLALCPLQIGLQPLDSIVDGLEVVALFDRNPLADLFSFSNKDILVFLLFVTSSLKGLDLLLSKLYGVLGLVLA